MYINNNRFSMRKRRRRTNWMRVIVLGLLILGGWYVNQVVIPDIDPIGIPSPTPTRAPESVSFGGGTIFEFRKTGSGR